MAKTSKASTINTIDKHPFKGFANFYPTKSDKEKIKKEAANTDKLLNLLVTFMEEGYVFKMGYDIKGQCLQVMMIGERTPDFNQGWIQSARHTDLLTAVSCMLYQHIVMAGEQQWDASSDNMFGNDW